jgi:spore maturation protein CgeB
VFAPGTEILIASEPREVMQILREMSNDRRLGIAANARARLLREHTPAHRARQLETYYLEALEQRPYVSNANRRPIELEEAK